MADLKHLVGPRNKGPLFLTQKGGRISLTHIKSIVASAGTNPDPGRANINPDLFRHSFTHNALQVGVPREKIRKILGHASIATTIDIYGEPSLAETQEDYEAQNEGLYG